jgi:hypothetical protein
MAKTSTALEHVPPDAVADSLRNQGIAFRGPFCSQSKRIVFVVENYIFLESELLNLLRQNKLDRAGIRQLAKRLDTANSKQYGSYQ